MADPVEKWGPGQKSLRYVVELSGEAHVRVSYQGAMGPSVRTYQVERVEVTTRWELGAEEWGRTVVKLACREVWGEARLPERVLYPKDLDEVPTWLAELEIRASPRDVG